MKPEMYLITKDFPYGHGEDTFAGAEYPYLCKAFQVSVIATEVEPDTEHGRTESINAHIVSVSVFPCHGPLRTMFFGCCIVWPNLRLLLPGLKYRL